MKMKTHTHTHSLHSHTHSLTHPPTHSHTHSHSTESATRLYFLLPSEEDTQVSLSLSLSASSSAQLLSLSLPPSLPLAHSLTRKKRSSSIQGLLGGSGGTGAVTILGAELWPHQRPCTSPLSNAYHNCGPMQAEVLKLPGVSCAHLVHSPHV